MLGIIKSYIELLGKNKKIFKLSILWNFVKSFGIGLQLLAIYIALKDILLNQADKMTVIYSLLVMLLSISILYLSTYIGRLYDMQASFYMCADKRRELGDKLKYLPMGYFNKNTVGQITSTATNTLETLQNIGTMVVMNIINGMINAIVLLVFMTVFDYRMGLIVLGTIVLFLLINMLLRKIAKTNIPKQHKAHIKIVEEILQYLQGLSVIRSYNLDKDAESTVNNSIDECTNTNIKLETKFIPFIVLQNIVFHVGTIAILIMAIVFYISGTMPIYMAIVMLIASFFVFAELKVAGTMSSLTTLIEKNIQQLKNQLATKSIKDGNEVDKNNFNITCNNVEFSYDKKKILDDVSFEIKEKTRTAIVGPSGGGKTTICNLMVRFWDVDKGSIKLGDKDIRDYKIDDLLSHFSMVFQQVYLFNDTVENNIKFGKPEATKEEIIEVAKKACIHDFIMSLENGYDTIIGEGGASISGGEKQRISIARAMLKDAEIIILDEATSNVDPENEELLQNAIAELTKEKTVIMIAHRLKTVRHANQILVIEDGKVSESGTHDELMKNDGTYKNFINTRRKSIGWKLGIK